MSNVEIEDFFLTLYFHNELAAGLVVGSVIGSVANHMFSFRKVRARLRAPKCHPAWDRMKETLRKETFTIWFWVIITTASAYTGQCGQPKSLGKAVERH